VAKLLASQQSAKTAKKSQKVKKVSANEVDAQVAAAAAAPSDVSAGSIVPGARVALAEGDNGGGGGGGSAALPILGGLAVAGGVAAFALGAAKRMLPRQLRPLRRLLARKTRPQPSRLRRPTPIRRTF